MERNQDLYAMLGVKRDASADEIRTAYRKLARELHPDVNPDDPVAGERFKDVSAAYKVLSDPEKRALYDEFGAESLSSGFDAEQARAYRQWRGGGAGPFAGAPFGAGAADEVHVGGDWRDLSDLFGDLFGGGAGGGRGFRADPRGHAGGPSRPRAGADVEAGLELDFLDAVRGFETTLVLAGHDPATGRATRREIRVKVPPGATTGRRIRLRGQGEPGRNGGPAGDLFVVPTVRPHPAIEREGSDLVMDLPVTVAEAVRGAKVSVPLPTGGRIQVTVPRGSQSGRRLRVRGKGVPAYRKRLAGDLYLRVMIRVPEAASADAVAAAERLNAEYERDVRSSMEVS